MNYLKRSALFLLCLLYLSNSSGQTLDWKIQPVQLKTRWAKNVLPSSALKEYPRPQMRRAHWTNLNGLWEYAITAKKADAPSVYEGKILVPFPLESALSGVKVSVLPEQIIWYRRTISFVPKASTKTLLHFGAVDYEATVFINGKEIGKHAGGYTRFSFDITSFLNRGDNELVVKVFDPTDKGVGPHGKQVLDPGNIYYTPSSGIWQTVWMEEVPENYIESLILTPDIDRGLVNIQVNGSSNGRVGIKVFDGKKVIAVVSSIQSSLPTEKRSVAVKIPNVKLWSPENPVLYDLEVTMDNDKVKSYFGMRKVHVGKDNKGIDRIMLNNKPYFNLGTLDQGFWPEGLYTAPTDEALAFDIRAIKAMGFNTIRKHIKIEPARWYYHADRIGILVWQDMVNPNSGLPEGAKAAFEKQVDETLEQLHNCPSITTWVLFNEKWGQYDQERLTTLLKQKDPSRLINGHSGEYLYVNDKLRSPSPNAYIGADMTDIHSYPEPMMSEKHSGKARVCGEFGGIAVAVPGHQWNDLKAWGYIQVSPSELERRYKQMVKKLKDLEQGGLSASIYTQPFDVESEENGFMTYDREIIKMPLEKLRTLHEQFLGIKSSKFLPSFKVGKVIAASSSDDGYDVMLAAFGSGRRDSAFLRGLSLMALRMKDEKNLKKVSNEYFSRLNAPTSLANINFFRSTVRDLDSPPLKYYISIYGRSSDSLIKQELKFMLKGLISKKVAMQFIKEKEPDVLKIENDVSKDFGELGTEVALENICIFFYLKKDVKGFAETKNRLLTLFPTSIPNNTLNNDAWFVFEQATTKDELNLASLWARRITTLEPDNTAFIDTYANILHKLGRTNEAIQWEEKAVKLSNGGVEFTDTLEKMKKGIPTWDVTKQVN